MATRFLRKAGRLARRFEAAARGQFGLVEAEHDLVSDSQEYWNAKLTERLKSHAHWKEGYAFDDQGVWDRLGRQHRDLLFRAARQVGLTELPRIIDWGCGGGMNAVQLASEARAYYGVDVSKSTLDECQRQVEAAGAESFRPVLVDVAEPEAALVEIGDSCDAFICTYVFELIPTREYGWRIVRLAHDALRPGGIALLHIRYATNLLQQSRPWHYASNLAHNTTYRLSEFREGAGNLGFEPLFEEVIPRQRDLRERRYAFFAMKRS